MTVNNFLQFNSGKVNSLTDAEYSANSAIANGITSGQASSKLHNKLFYQLSTFVKAISQTMSDSGFDMSDSSLVTLISNIKSFFNTKLDITAQASDSAKLAGSLPSAFASAFSVVASGQITIANGATANINLGSPSNVYSFYAYNSNLSDYLGFVVYSYQAGSNVVAFLETSPSACYFQIINNSGAARTYNYNVIKLK